MPSLGLVPIPRRRRCSAKLEEKNFRKVASGRPDDDMGTQTSVGHAVHHQRTALKRDKYDHFREFLLPHCCQHRTNYWR